MTKDECIIRQEKFILYLNNMIKDIRNLRDEMIDYDDDVINEKLLGMPDNEEIIAVCKLKNSKNTEIEKDANIVIISTLGASLLCSRTGVMVNKKYLSGEELLNFFSNQFKEKNNL